MLTLTFVRHGQTDCSLGNHFCGSSDVPLNKTGLEMAEALGAAYASEPWAAIYASPLLRARQTAEPLARRLGQAVQIEDGLREISYGDWEGLVETEIEQLYPADRALRAVGSIRDRHPDGHVLAVAHKATIRIVVCALLGIDLCLYRARVAQEVGAATTFQFKDAGPLLLTLNDVSLLPPHLRHAGGT